MPSRSTRALIAAAAAAVVTVTAAAAVVANQGPTSVKKITGTNEHAPGLAWSLDAAEYLGRPFGDFSDPRGGSSYMSGTPGFILAADTLVTIVGIPTDRYVLDEAVMIGVDPENGSVRWRAPAADLEQCSDQPIDGKIYCYAQADGHAIVTYDLKSGASERRSVEEYVFGLTTTADTLYIIEGSPEDGEVRVHSGNFDDVSANWTQKFDVSGGWEDVYQSGVLTVADEVGLVRMGVSMAQFDADSGNLLWGSGESCVSSATLEPGGVVVQSNSGCGSDDTESEQLLRGPDGKVLATSTSPEVQYPVFEHADADDPVLLGDSAYDRTTGERLWTNPDLVAGQSGTVTAVVGNTAYLSDTTNARAVGIDVRSGKQLWRTDGDESLTPLAAGGGLLVGSGVVEGTEALMAVDIGTGEIVWTAPFVAIDADPETFRSGRAMTPYDNGWILSSDRRMIGLTPL
ncbi:putative pyrroloquinoline-quinone binding quinoprotein [Williamsia muralis]|uniref:Putative pyrroloquinoline-quinone binding quinoprotein n=1 Tax=Williamsia marianensis TaxID=85044 RepID=A0A495JZ12_WILMA|nr:PQQ-binding-like beta-propeller repeat protein [Williamsia muralis]RKR93419.1 putative pyrroloquinoline-quinone binding quinoprotein [Williamsia muralis]